MSTSTTAKRWLSNKEAAARMGIHPATLTNWRCKGRGPRFEKLSDTPKARIRYSAHVVDAWVRSEKGAA